MTVIETAARPARRLEWQRADVREIVVETYRVKSLLLHVADWQGHLPGQHLDIRLTAEDGYQAQRSYSIGSPPEDELLTLTVERWRTARFLPISSTSFAPATDSNCAGRSAGISSGRSPRAARYGSSGADRELCR